MTTSDLFSVDGYAVIVTGGHGDDPIDHLYDGVEHVDVAAGRLQHDVAAGRDRRADRQAAAGRLHQHVAAAGDAVLQRVVDRRHAAVQVHLADRHGDAGLDRAL